MHQNDIRGLKAPLCKALIFLHLAILRGFLRGSSFKACYAISNYLHFTPYNSDRLGMST